MRKRGGSGNWGWRKLVQDFVFRMKKVMPTYIGGEINIKKRGVLIN